MKKLLILVVMVTLFFASSWVVIFKPLFITHDYVHGARLAEMSRALADGHLPVRWSTNFGYGYGMPLFSFYGPLPYFLGSLVFLSWPNLTVSVKFIIIFGNLLTLVGAYYLGKYKWSRSAGLVIGALYLLAPYRAVNIFVRGAVSESWGMAFMPWILWSSWLVVDRRRNSILYLAVAVCLLLLSHNLTAMIALPFLMGFTLIWWLVEKLVSKNTKSMSKIVAIKTVGQLIGGYLLGVGLASFYVLPAILEKKYTQLNQLIQTGYFDFHHHFLYLRQFFLENWGYGGSGWGPDDGLSFFLGYPQILALGLILLWLVVDIYKNKKLGFVAIIKHHALLAIIAIFIIAATFLSTAKTIFLWENLLLLQYLQFPWRFLSLIAFFFSVLIAYWLTKLNSSIRFLVATTLIMLSIFLSFRYFKAQDYLTHPNDFYYQDESKIRSQMSGVLPDYLPKDVSVEKLPQIFDDFVDFSSVERNNSSVLLKRTNEKLYSVLLESERNIELPIAYFPGWVASVDGETVPITVSPRGLIQLSKKLTTGKHLIGAQFQETPVRQAANIISLVCLAGIIIALPICRKKY